MLKKHGVSTIEFNVCMVKAWLKDEDTAPNKIMAYYECVVKK